MMRSSPKDPYHTPHIFRWQNHFGNLWISLSISLKTKHNCTMALPVFDLRVFHSFCILLLFFFFCSSSFASVLAVVYFLIGIRGSERHGRKKAECVIWCWVCGAQLCFCCLLPTECNNWLNWLDWLSPSRWMCNRPGCWESSHFSVHQFGFKSFLFFWLKIYQNKEPWPNSSRPVSQWIHYTTSHTHTLAHANTCMRLACRQLRRYTTQDPHTNWWAYIVGRYLYSRECDDDNMEIGYWNNYNIVSIPWIFSRTTPTTTSSSSSDVHSEKWMQTYPYLFVIIIFTYVYVRETSSPAQRVYIYTYHPLLTSYCPFPFSSSTSAASVFFFLLPPLSLFPKEFEAAHL